MRRQRLGVSDSGFAAPDFSTPSAPIWSRFFCVTDDELSRRSSSSCERLYADAISAGNDDFRLASETCGNDFARTRDVRKDFPTVSHEHLHQLMETARGLLHQYGYAGLFALIFVENFGFPVPGETVFIAAILAAAHGEMRIVAGDCVRLVGIRPGWTRRFRDRPLWRAQRLAELRRLHLDQFEAAIEN